ncbi:MAG: hypothetical protein SR1Q7_10760 [Quinella sp. 1Q7]|nr:hypothetical protein [Quinella sp. 1Q7]
MSAFEFDLQRFVDDDSLNTDEKQQLRESSLPHLRMICNVAKNPIVTALFTVLENNKDALELIDKNVSPVYSLIGSLYKRQFGKNGLLKLKEEADLFSSAVKIADSILDVYDNLVGADADTVTNKCLGITNEALKICNTATRLQNKGESGFVLSLVTASLSYGLTVLASLDNLTPEAQTKINKTFIKSGGTTIKTLLKEFASNAEKFTAPFGLVDMGVSAFVGIIEGFSQIGVREEYYSDDGLPEDIARKEALLDALSSGLHETFTTYLKGADDVAFKAGQFLSEGCKWLAHAFSGDFGYEITISEKNYMEFVREAALKGEYGSTSTADVLTVSGSSTSLYAQDGDDYIENVYSHVTILAGHGNDLVSSYGGAKYNSMFGGNGDDYLYIHDTGSTIVGGNNDDHLLIYKDKNIVNGNDGNDYIFVQGASNTVSGGANTDLIELRGATKTVIEYTQGDGTDVIYGYDVSDLIKIKGNYSTVISGNDVLIYVGDGGIIVKDAKDLKININTIELAEDETLPTSGEIFFTNPYNNAIVLMDGLWSDQKALRGTNGNDYIENTLSNVMIYGFDGSDTIINRGNNVTINSGAGADKIYNYGATVKINAGDDNDYIYNEGYKATLVGADGSDTIDNSGADSFIDGGAGNDSIVNSGDNSRINGADGKDTIQNSGYNSRINGGNGMNYIENTDSYVTIEGSDDEADVIYSSGNGVSINAYEGNNSISIDGAAGGYQTVTAGDGDNTIQVGERDETEEIRYCNYIDVGNGNNYINNSNVERSTISAGSGNDTIITGGGDGYYTSIVAGDNRITVNSYMRYGEIYAGAGNDLVSIGGEGYNNIISVGSGNDSVIADIDNSTINVGAGENFVSLYSSGDSVIAGSGDDYVIMAYNGGGNNASLGSGNNTLISSGRENVTAGAGDDKVTVAGGHLELGDGKNNVLLTYGGNTDIFTGAGNDTINVDDKAEEVTDTRTKNYIDAGDGNNYINNSNVELSTIAAGSGNDTIITGGGNYSNGWYTSIVAGAGDNRITVNSSMTEGEIYAGAGNDLVSLGGEGSNNIISVGNGRNSIITSTYYDPAYNQYNTITAGTGSDAIRTSGNYNYINAGSGRNSITPTGGERNSIITGKGNDTIRLSSNTNNNVIIFGGGKDLVYNYHSGDTVKAIAALSVSTVGNDIVLTDGTSRMTLKSASGKTINTQELSSSDSVYKILVADKTVGDTLMPSGLPDKTPTEPVGPTALKADNALNSISFVGTILDDTITNSGKKVTIVGNAGDDSIGNKGANVSINGGKGDDTVTNSGAKVTILGGAGDDYISNTGATVSVNAGKGDDTVTNSGTKVTILGGAGDDSIGNKGANVSINGGAGDDIVINSGAKVTIVGGTGDDSIINTGANVNVSGGKGDDSITSSGDGVTLSGGAGDDMFIYGAGKAFISDYAEGHDTIKIASGTISNASLNGSDVVFTIGKNSLTVKNGKGKSIALIDSAGKNSTQTVSDILTVTNAVKSPVTVAPYVKTIDASARTSAVRITGNDLANTIMSVSGNATLTGGKGNDTFIYKGGKTVISDYTAGDKISLGAAITATTVSGSNVIFTVGSGSLTINNAKGKALALIDAKGKSSTATISDVLTVTNSTKSPVTVPAYVKTVNASKRTSAVRITGNASANSIVGGSSADSLNGGSGNDTLTGGKGNDVFIYSGGKDVISDYASGDKISVNAAISKASVSGSNVVFSVGKGTLTVSNGRDKTLALMDAKGNSYSAVVGATDSMNINLTNSTKSPVTLDAAVKTVDASKRTKAIKLTGNASANSIVGGSGADSLYGGAGNDTLRGGKGNDNLWGDKGNDTFIYASGDGTDVIHGFDSGDLLKITGAFSASYSKSTKSVAFKVGSGSITIKDFGSTTTFRVNNDTYQLSGNKLNKK